MVTDPSIVTFNRLAAAAETADAQTMRESANEDCMARITAR
jgi:hypothetical protein